MDARTVTGNNIDSNSDWNGSDEEDSHIEDSMRLDRLSLEQGKMADTRGSITSLDFLYKEVMMAMMIAKTMTDGEGKVYDRFAGIEEQKEEDDFDDSHPGPSGVGSVSGNSGTVGGNSGTVGGPVDQRSHPFVTSSPGSSASLSSVRSLSPFCSPVSDLSSPIPELSSPLPSVSPLPLLVLICPLLFLLFLSIPLLSLIFPLFLHLFLLFLFALFYLPLLLLQLGLISLIAL